jgi:ABC-type thiamine transport system ATPase subunit
MLMIRLLTMVMVTQNLKVTLTIIVLDSVNVVGLQVSGRTTLLTLIATLLFDVSGDFMPVFSVSTSMEWMCGLQEV